VREPAVQFFAAGACVQYPAYDGLVILFEKIIEALHRLMPTILHQSTRRFDAWEREQRRAGRTPGNKKRRCPNCGKQIPLYSGSWTG
jgi:hypothetical protein